MRNPNATIAAALRPLAADLLAPLPKSAGRVVVLAGREGLGGEVVSQAFRHHFPESEVLDAGLISDWQQGDAPPGPTARALVLIHPATPPRRTHQILGQVMAVFAPAAVFIHCGALPHERPHERAP